MKIENKSWKCWLKLLLLYKKHLNWLVREGGHQIHVCFPIVFPGKELIHVAKNYCKISSTSSCWFILLTGRWLSCECDTLCWDFTANSVAKSQTPWLSKCGILRNESWCWLPCILCDWSKGSGFEKSSCPFEKTRAQSHFKTRKIENKSWKCWLKLLLFYKKHHKLIWPSELKFSSFSEFRTHILHTFFISLC